MVSAKSAAAAIACNIWIALAAASPAFADSEDDQFLGSIGSINDAGLVTLVEAAPDVVIDTGESVCSMLDDGYGVNAVTGMIVDNLAMWGDDREYTAGLFGVYAVATYCPEHQEDSPFVFS